MKNSIGKNIIVGLIVIILSIIILAFYGYSVNKKDESVKNVVIPQYETDLSNYEKNLFNYNYNINIKGNTDYISFILPLPKDENQKQYIKSLELSPKPSKIYNDDVNRIAHFEFYNIKDTKININLKGIAYTKTYDLKRAKKLNKNISPENDLKRYLKSEELIESDDEYIKNIAKSIKGKTQEEIIENIYEYLQKTIKYELISKNIGAKQALILKKGKCSEFAAAMCALCRAKNIPARIVSGNIIKNSNTQHCWVEIYFKNYGWVAFDATLKPVVVNIYKNNKLIKKETKPDSSNIYVNYIESAKNKFTSWELSYNYKDKPPYISIDENIQIKK